MKHWNEALLTLLQDRIFALQVGTMILGHELLQLFYPWQEHIISILYDILPFMAIHIDTLSQQTSPISQFQQPLSCCMM